MTYSLKSILKTPLTHFIGNYSNPPIDLLLAEKGVVEYYMNNPPFYDEPKVYGFASLLHKSASIKKYHSRIAPEIFIGFAGGASINKNRALWKVIGESIERYALFMNGRKGIKGSFNQLSKNRKLLDPQIIFSSKDEKQTSDKRKAIIDWTQGVDLTNRTNCLLPTQLVAVPYWDCGNENIWRAPITTGAATGSSLPSAIFSGICEVVERDAFMISWLKQLQLQKIVAFEETIKKSQDQYALLFIKTLQAVQRYNLLPEFYILPNDTHIYTVMCVLKDETKIAPPITIGLDADLSIVKTMLGALEECLQLRPWMRQLYETEKSQKKSKPFFNIENLEQRARLWLNNKSTKVLNNWLKQSTPCQLENLLNNKVEQTLQELISSIGNQGATVYFTNLTNYIPNTARQKKLCAVKVVIPEYQPLYLIERYADRVWQRLISAEERLGSKSLIPKNNFQGYPHPHAMKTKFILQHKKDYESSMELLISLLEKITFELGEESNSKTTKTNWSHLITHHKSYPRLPKIKLDKNYSTDFSKLISKRTSIRKFDPDYKISKITLSSILSKIKDYSSTDFPKRPFPSAGALYPSNTYCIINNGSDIEKGLYFFNHKENCLELLLQKDLRADVDKAISDKNISNPSVIFVLTNSYYKPCLKYGARGFLYSLIEIGALAQTLNLSCIESGLDCLWLGGFSDETMKDILDIKDDLEIELPTLLIAAGKAVANKRIAGNPTNH